MELHGGSSNFPYAASAMRQLLGDSGTSHLPFSLITPSLLPPQGILGMVWLRLLASCAPGSRGPEWETSGKPLCSSYQQREMVSDAAPGQRVVGWAVGALVQLKERGWGEGGC